MKTVSEQGYHACFASKTKEEKDQDDKTYKKYEELMSTLPKKRVTEDDYDQHQYQGFWYHPDILKGTMAAQNHYQSQQTDILLATMPKSGTTWLKALIFAIKNRKVNPTDMLLTLNSHELMPFLEARLYANDLIPDLSVLPTPRLLATHIPYHSLPQSIVDSGCKIVYLCRNPKDNFVSLWHFRNKLRAAIKKTPIPIDKEFESFCEGWSAYGSFWEHVLEYWRVSLENPNRVLFLMFEEMKADPPAQLKKLADFLECPFSQEEQNKGVVDEILGLCSFTNMKNLEVNKSGTSWLGFTNSAFFRKGRVGNWVSDLTPEMIERIDKITEEKLQGSGLRFQLN
ncbi:hypothetical protein GIB67_001795 [Kingdonia uniflora]|uniref:Sulfotransferase n=1 Tax=Kingdonia uniflora TaxID=39325 RepID=A0A7J7LC09_9MAGN|nr:hypothetical protein GIB67_001795 [Kingdonia uniflora]